MRSTPVALVLAALMTSVAMASTILVDLNGGGDYLTIQAGVDAASEGDTVLVAPGVYTGTGNRNINFGGTNLVLRSIAGADSTVIAVPDVMGYRVMYLSSGEDTTSVLDGFTCRGLRTGVVLSGAGLTVRDCVFEETGVSVGTGAVVVRRTTFRRCRNASNGGAMYCSLSSVLIEDALFDECELYSAYGGWGMAIYLTHCDATIERTRFERCYERDAWGTLYAEYSTVSLAHVTFWHNDVDYDLQVRGGCLNATNLTMVAGPCAIRTESGAAVDIENSIIAFNRVPFTGVTGTTVTHSCMFGNTVGDSLSCSHRGNLFVDPLLCDLPGGAVTIAGGSQCLPAGNPWGVLIGDMPYGCSPREIRVNPEGTGDFPTIQAAIDSADVWDAVLLADGVYTGAGNRDLDYHGKRLTVRSEHGDPTLCVIDCDGTEAEPHRGAAFTTGETYESVLAGVTIADGYADLGGGILCQDSGPLVVNCIIRDNEAVVGGGLYAGTCWPPVEFRECAFVSNVADSGGAAAVDENEAGYKNIPSATFARCTIAGNTASVGAGLRVFAGGISGLFSVDSVVAFNGPGEGIWGAFGTYDSLAIEHTDIYGNEGGDWVGWLAQLEHQYGNLSEDPLFCAGGFSHLEDCSPCIGAASDGGDIGASEVGCPCGDPTGVDVEPAALQLVSVSNPARETCRFSFYRAGLPADITLTIYSIEGRRVAELTLPAQRSGLGSVRWNCTDSSGSRVASGVYPYQISDGESSVRGLVTIVR